MLRTRTSRWTMGTVVLCLLLLVAAWLLLISPRRSEAADLGDQNVAAQRDNDQLETRIEGLKAQAAQLPAYRTELAEVLQQLPPTAAMPQLLRDLNTLASASGVTLDTFTPSGSSPVTAATAAPGGKAGAGAAAGAAGAAAGAGAGAAAGAGASGVVQIPLAMVARGDYFQAVAFVQKLQTQLSRAFLVSSVQVAKSSSGGSGQIQLSLTGYVFAWPGGSQVVPTAQPTASPTVTATASSTVTSAYPTRTSSPSTTGGGTP